MQGIKTKQELIKELKDIIISDGIGLSIEIEDEFGRISIQSDDVYREDGGVDEQMVEKFIRKYIGIIEEGIESGGISEVEIGVHTDTKDTYENRSRLSNDLAEELYKYFTNKSSSLQDYLTYRGYSYSEPIYNEKGMIDNDLSSRVTLTIK